MKSDPTGPADTRMMPIVHQALRRDLTRTRTALSSGPYPAGGRHIAIAKHAGWMMQFLHDHHNGEDAGLWPVVRQRNPNAAALLDDMAADHRRISPAIGAVESAVHAYAVGGSDEARTRLLDALDNLNTGLLPHLQREEEEMMPVVSASISQGEYHAWDQQYNIQTKSFVQLGHEGHWLLDELDATGCQIVVHEVPAIPRFILLRGFARRYRRLAAACWGSEEREPVIGRLNRSGRVEVLVEAPIEAVWGVAADVTRIGEWSHECRGAEWLDGATAAAPGVRFRGRNKAGRLAWSRASEIMLVREPEELVWRTCPTLLYPDSSEWRIRLEPVGDGTRVVQTFHVLHLPALLDRLYSLIIPAHRDRTSALADDLRRLGAVAIRHSTPGQVRTPDKSVIAGTECREDIPSRQTHIS